ncbi:hypothetical protein IHE45_20G027900 [Dioscorea alata]|uniref:Uncharacterized protein n=2 Tax=Dioscorea alata TaxID=55571 RepID=A0ACB7TQZ9_DIOAL|nr:hypothetical protein IHE45_20G027900 [Dioscorea alata]KAH7650996.1 hypothetical protein IHE45_20G027900 [Dioscorea alata]
MNFGRKVLFDLYSLMIFTEYLYSDMLHGARDEPPALGGIHLIVLFLLMYSSMLSHCDHHFIYLLYSSNCPSCQEEGEGNCCCSALVWCGSLSGPCKKNFTRLCF